MKILYLDTETTGLDPIKNDVIQIGAIVEINGVVKEEINLRCQPFDYSTIQQQALDTNKITIEQLKTFPTPQSAYKLLIKILNKHINKFDKEDKFIPVGQNINFDLGFMRQFFLKNNDKYFGSYVDRHYIDLMAIAGFFTLTGHINPPNLKLGTIAQILGIEFDAHDAFEDIVATRQCLLAFRKFMKE